MPSYLYPRISMYFVIKEIMANYFECTAQPTKLNTDGFAKLIFRGKSIFSYYKFVKFAWTKFFYFWPS